MAVRRQLGRRWGCHAEDGGVRLVLAPGGDGVWLCGAHVGRSRVGLCERLQI